MDFSRKSILTLSGAVILAGTIIVGGIYGPTAWKVFRGQVNAPEDQVVIQTPTVNYAGQDVVDKSNADSQGALATGAKEDPKKNTNTEPKNNPITPNNTLEPGGIVKYKEPDLSLLNLAPSIEDYFGEGSLSDAARTLAYGTAWNIHQYTSGYLNGVTAGPQMNEADIRKYILFHKTLWEKQMENEVNSNQAATFDIYLRNLLNRGIDAFDAKDKIRIQQFHQEISDLDSHLFRDDMGAQIYGATPFATKRSD